MTWEVIVVVLAAALMHAGWNTIAKLNAGRAGDAVVVGVLAGIPALPCLAWTGFPDSAAWPMLAASVAIHLAYFRVLALAYRHADMSVAYPLMRGIPPVLVALLGGWWFGEGLTLQGWCAVLALASGVLLLAWESSNRGSLRAGSARLVALQVGVILVYTLVDGIGVRASGNAASYAAWMFALTALALLPWAGRSLRLLARESRGAVAMTLLGGLMTFGSYSIALWAMTRAPVALVAALRETAIVFGAAFAARVVGERFGVCRWTAVGLVLAGTVATRLA